MSISMPEQPLLVYPSLVARFGLEESLLLGCYQRLAELTGTDNGSAVVVTLSRPQWLRLVPFWDEEKLAVLTNSLVVQQAIEAAFEGDIVTLEMTALQPQAKPLLPQEAARDIVAESAADAETGVASQPEMPSQPEIQPETELQPQQEPLTALDDDAALLQPVRPDVAHSASPLAAKERSDTEAFDLSPEPPQFLSAQPLSALDGEPPLLNVAVDELPESSPYFDRPVGRLLAEEAPLEERPVENRAASLLDDLVPGRDTASLSDNLNANLNDNEFLVEVEPVDRLPVVEEPPQFMQPVHQVHQARYPDEVPPAAQPLVPGRGPAPTFGGSTGWARNRQANRARTGDELQEIFQQREVRNQQLHAIFVGWKPSDSFFAMLPHHGIPEEFARDCIDGFILYWLDKDRRETNWDSKFLGWVKREWVHKQTAAGRQQRQEQEQQKGFVNNENTRTDSRAKRQRVTRAIMDIRDTDW